MGKKSVTPDEIKRTLDHILPTVAKPGRYVGGELNQIEKDWHPEVTSIALVFPDIYDLGMSNLALAILYDLINRRPDALAERAYAPWIDMEVAMRSAGLPLYSLETKHPLASFDIIGFTLPYESLYTNALNILDLAGILGILTGGSRLKFIYQQYFAIALGKIQVCGKEKNENH